MKTLTVSDKDFIRTKKLLAQNGIPTEPEEDKPIPFLRKSKAEPDESPAAFGGIWASDERTLATIRAKAWPKRS
jgi:hypothetical protein